jgi:hypothetical protein
MSFEGGQPEELTTRQAAALTGRTMDAVKSAIHIGTLTGTRKMDGWRVKREDVLAWHARTRLRSRYSSRPWDRAAELLVEYGSLSIQEMAPLLGRHPGNARKYLAILKAEGRAERLSDGQWVLVEKQAAGAA